MVSMELVGILGGRCQVQQCCHLLGEMGKNLIVIGVCHGVFEFWLYGGGGVGIVV